MLVGDPPAQAGARRCRSSASPGGPFTLASYLVEGGKSANFAKTKKLMFGAPDAWAALMEKLAEVVRRYLRAQIAAGVDAVQLFDSWVGDLAPADYVEYVQPHVRRVLADVEAAGVPVIHFGTGTATLLEAMRDAGGTVIGVDWCTPLDTAWARVGLRPRGPGQHRPVRSPGDAGGGHARTRSESSTRRPGGPGTSSTSGTASCPRRPSTTCARWSSTCASERAVSATAVVLVSHGTVDDLDDLAAFVDERAPGPAGAPGARSRAAPALRDRSGAPRSIASTRSWPPSSRPVSASRSPRPIGSGVPSCATSSRELAGQGVRRVVLVPLAPHSAHVYADDAGRAPRRRRASSSRASPRGAGAPI